MDVVTTLEVDPLAKELGDRFQAAGHELYLVGGAVRDLVLSRLAPGVDTDFATDASPAETSRLLRGWAEALYLVGAKFGTVGARRHGNVLEITTFREERYPEDERKPAVTFAKDIQTDLSRRDFTINAMAVRLPDGEFVDPYEGVKDLAAKVLDTPLDPEVAFSDDPLRMLRAARFVSQLGVTPAPRVVDAIHRMRERLRIVSSERIHAELDKLLVGDAAGAGLTCSSIPGSPTSSFPSSRRSSSNRIPYIGTKMCCATRSRSSNASSPIPCSGSPVSSTTSGSRQPGRSRPTGSLPPPRGRRRADGGGAAPRAPLYQLHR